MPSSLETFGDRNPLLANANYYPTGDSIALADGSYAAYGAIYRYQVWVNTLIRKLAFGTARLPKKNWDPTPGSRVEVFDTPFAQLMRRPNPRMSGFRLWLWTSSTYDINGEAIWIKLRDDKGVVRELYPVHPSNVIVWRDTAGEFGDVDGLWYIYTLGARNAPLLPPIPEADVVHFRNFNPDNTTRGLSNLEPLRQTLLNDEAIRQGTTSFWQNGLRPSMTVSHPKSLSDDAMSRLRTQLESRHAGSKNFGRVAVLEEGMKADVVQLSAEEMQYIQGRQLNRDECCSALDVPPPAVHILDRATFSNITEQMRSVYRDTQAPRLEGFEAEVEHSLRPEFAEEGEEEFAFDLDGVLRGDFETRAAVLPGLVGSGIVMPDEGREVMNLPSAGPEARKLYGNAALVPLGSAPRNSPKVATDGSMIPTPIGDPDGGDGSTDTVDGPPPAMLPTKQTLTARGFSGQLARKAPSDARAHAVDQHKKALRAFFTKQGDAVKAAMSKIPPAMTGPQVVDPNAVFNAGEWDDELTQTMTPLAQGVGSDAGQRTARSLGGVFDASGFNEWTAAFVAGASKAINNSTASLVGAALNAEDPNAALEQLFGSSSDGRADRLAATRVTTMQNAGSQDAATQNGAGEKTWNVNSGNPRASHADIDGQTVGIDEAFDNGLQYPGDPNGDVDETAGCTCTLTYSRGGTDG